MHLPHNNLNTGCHQAAAGDAEKRRNNPSIFARTTSPGSSGLRAAEVDTPPIMIKIQPIALALGSLRLMLPLLIAVGTIALMTGCGGAEAADEYDGPAAIEEATTAHAMAVTPTNAAALYIDASRGADTNAGTATAPWKTLARLSKIRMTKGQRILLHCSGTWRETLNLGAAQLADDVTIEPYGSGCNGQRPRILGSDDFSGGWVREGALWWRAVPNNTPKIARLFVNGEPMQLARWPNATATPEYAEVDNTSTTPQLRQFTVAPKQQQALAGVDLTGATVQIRSAPWRIDTATVQAYAKATGTVSLVTNTSYAIPAGTDVVLQDKPWMLDAPGEYLHDVQRQRIYLHPPIPLEQVGPNGARIEGSVRDHGAMLAGRTNLTLRGINIENARHTGLTVQAAPNARLNNVQAHNNLAIGISLVTAPTTAGSDPNPSVTLQDSVITGSSLYGVDAGSAARARIVNNQIADIGNRSEAGNSFAALRLGPASVAESNRISNVAYIGIRFNGSGGSQIRNNRIDAFCTRLGDCAAIYTWNGPKEKPNLVDQRALIEGNTLLGTASRAAHTTLKSGWITAGIYLDDYSRGATVRNNVVGHTPIGIYVHNGSSHTIESNKVWLTTRAAIWANMDQVNVDYMTGNSFLNNELVPVALVQGQWPAPPAVQTSQAIWYWQKLASYDALVTSGGNQFSANRVVLLNESTGQHVHVRGASFDTYLDTSAWQRLNPGETIATTPARYAPYALTLGPELLRGGGFDKGWGGWGKWLSPQGSGGYANPTVNATGCTGGCIAFASATPNDLISSPSFNLTPGRPYRIAMDATFPQGGSIGIPYVSRNGPPWDSFAAPGSFAHLNRTQAAAGEHLAYEGVFQATAATDARLSIKLATPGAATNIDNVSLKEIAAYSISPIKELAAILSAAAGGTRNVNCVDIEWTTGCAVVNIDGRAISLPTAIEPGNPLLLLKAR